VVGAGLVGAASARALADAGWRVRVLDAGEGRAAASWAAAGLLSVGSPQRVPPAVHELGARSLELWRELGRRHPAIELRRTGMLVVGDDPEWAAWRAAAGLPTERTRWRGRPALRLPEVEVVRANRCAPALLGDIPVERARVDDVGALRDGADLVVVAAGAWAAPLLAALGVRTTVAPRRGQMMIFDRGDLPTVLYRAGGEELAVPRADGRVLIGTTLEDAGFDAAPRDEDLDRLEAWARSEISGLGRREDAWAGLRPWSPDPAPAIGWAADGVIVAAGHFRNGILLAPGTGEIVRALAEGREPFIPAASFAPGRPG
jgi:glycine oxidase